MKKIIGILIILLPGFIVQAQTLTLEQVIENIKRDHPALKMFDNEIKAMDEAAKGARSWMPPEVGAGFFMTPYNPRMWKADMGREAMGSFMLSAQQMFPNRKKLDAQENLMLAMSSTDKERKNFMLNELVFEAKKNYVEWMVLEKKLKIIEENEKLLQYMIGSAEIKYKYGMEKLNAYYKAKASLSEISTMRVMLENNINQSRIQLNTLMNRDKQTRFFIDTTYEIKNHEHIAVSEELLSGIRSDIKALNEEIKINELRIASEKAQLKPELGIRFDNMIGFSTRPVMFTAMGMVKIPMARWSRKMNEANAESFKWKNEALENQKQMVLNESAGMAKGMQREIEAFKKQLSLYDKNIIPALRKNFQTVLLAYEQNTEELFMLFDAWETLNMAQLNNLEQLSKLLRMQVEYERILEIK